MAALLSSDVTVSVPIDKRDIGHGRLMKNLTMADVTFGDGAKTYPTGGVPLPAIGSFGFARQVDFAALEDPPANGFVYKYDRSNHKIKIFTQGITTGSTAAATPENGALAENSAGAETTVRLAGSAVDTSYDLGAMIELPATIAPAAVTVRMMMLGE